MCLGQSLGQVPLPDIDTANQVRLRIAYAYNPRLEEMSAEQLEELLAEAKRYAANHLDVALVYLDLDVIRIDALFRLVDRAIAVDQMSNAYPFRERDNPRRRDLVDSVAGCLRQLSGEQIEQMREFAKPYLPVHASIDSLNDFAESLVDTQLARLDQWLHHPALDTRPVIDAQPFNEWSLWVALGYADLPYDVILTNQLVASVEYYHCSAHTIIRGGISVGGTNYSRSGLYQAYVFLSTYPFTSNAGTLPSLRGDDVYTTREAGKFAGAYLSHELGHLLFHFGHPFGRTPCIMNPSSLLRFREWYEATNKGDCPFESHPQMVPGAFEFLYKIY